MFPNERREGILAYLETQGRVTVEELAELFDISVDSIRKDLKALSKQGLLKRVYGGAIRIDREAEAPTPSDIAAAASAARIIPEPTATIGSAADPAKEESRRQVASRAYMEINDGDAIFLDISETSRHIAEMLAAGDKRCIVTTNMIDIPAILAKNPLVTALVTGGYLSPDMRGFTGPTTISLLEPLLFEKAFISCTGISLPKRSVTCDTMENGQVKQRAIENATYKFLLAEHSKFDFHAGYRFASLTDFTAIITGTTDVGLLGDIAAMGVPALC